MDGGCRCIFIYQLVLGSTAAGSHLSSWSKVVVCGQACRSAVQGDHTRLVLSAVVCLVCHWLVERSLCFGNDDTRESTRRVVEGTTVRICSRPETIIYHIRETIDVRWWSGGLDLLPSES